MPLRWNKDTCNRHVNKVRLVLKEGVAGSRRSTNIPRLWYKWHPTPRREKRARGMKTKNGTHKQHTSTEMATKRNCSELNDGDEVKRSVPTQVTTQIDDLTSKIRENCQELIANAEQEAITIVTAAAQCTEAMKKELADLEEKKKLRMEAINKELDEEKKRIANTHAFGPMVKLDVGGQLFTTATATLTRFPDTMLGAMFSGRHALTQDRNGAYCIDRDGRHFHEILNFLRGSTASTQQQIEGRLGPAALNELKVEADFYGVKDLMFPMTILLVTGATGVWAGQINGAYQETTELSGGMPLYVKVWDSSMCLEYYAANKQWQVKKVDNKSTDGWLACCAVPDKCMPQECPGGKWVVCTSSSLHWIQQSTITINVATDK